MKIDDFWKPWEKEVDSFESAIGVIHDVFDKWSSDGRVFAWRGQVDASWALHSSLYRRLAWTQGARPDEAQQQDEEDEILKAVHRWGLHTGERGRLSALSQLAVLQHYGAPTRLIDVTFNPLIGLWFAVEAQWNNGEPANEARDGRLFAIDVTNRLINEDKQRRSWEDDLRRPWPRSSDSNFSEWNKQTFAWRPPHLDHRIAAQNGGFLFGGVPTSPQQWRKTTSAESKWKEDETRAALSIPLQFHKLAPIAGVNPQSAAYTLRISQSAKVEIRNKLEKLYGYTHSTIYRDYSGFASYGRPLLKSRP